MRYAIALCFVVLWLAKRYNTSCVKCCFQVCRFCFKTGSGVSTGLHLSHYYAG